MNSSKLAYWERSLQRYGFRCKFHENDSQVRYPRINVNLGGDTLGRERILEIRLDTYLLPPDEELYSQIENKENTEESLVHLFAALPFFIQPGAMADTSRLLMILNKPLDIPGFGLDEKTRLVFFRYSLISHKGQLSSRLLIAMIGTIHLLIDSLSPQIEAVASGKGLKETLAATVQALTATPEKLTK